MTIEQAIARFEARANKLREEGHWAVAHEWQTRANEMARLGDIARNLPTPPRKKKGT